jgi:hypothetical protein
MHFSGAGTEARPLATLNNFALSVRIKISLEVDTPPAVSINSM